MVLWASVGVESWCASSLSSSAEAIVATRRTLPSGRARGPLPVLWLDWTDAMGNWTYRFAVDMSTPAGSVGQALDASWASETSGEFEASQVILASTSSLAPALG